MSFFESILYGLITGLSEFLPVSSQGHQAVLLRLWGLDSREPIRDLLVHVAVLIALIFGCKSTLIRLYREKAILARSRRSRTYEFNGIYDLRHVKAAAIPMMILLIVYTRSVSIESMPLCLTLTFLLNGLLLLIPEHSRQANKTARNMSGFDGVLMGIFSGLSFLPGVSRVGIGMGIMTIRGADRGNNLTWALLLSIPALILWIVFDFVHMFTIGVGALSFLNVLSYLLSAGFAFAGGLLGISFARFLVQKSGFLSFAYYSFGMAMFTFILYLIA